MGEPRGRPRYYWVRYPEAGEVFIAERVEGGWYFDGSLLAEGSLEAVEGPLAVPEARSVPSGLSKRERVERALLVAWRAGDFSKAGTRELEELVLAVQLVEGKS